MYERVVYEEEGKKEHRAWIGFDVGHKLSQ